MLPWRLLTVVALLALCLWGNITVWRRKRTKHVAKPLLTAVKHTPHPRFVLLLHSTGSAPRLRAVRETWFQPAPDVGLAIMEPKATAFETTRAALAQALAAFPKAMYYGKFDDDTYVYTRELFRQVEAGRHNYSGYPIRLDDQLVFGSGGAGYVLSRRAAEVVARCVAGDPQYEDAAVGQCLRGFAPLHDLIGLHPHHPYQMLRWDKHGHPSDRVHRREPLEGYMNPLSYHYIDPADMVRMHGVVRGGPVPRVLHQFWEGANGRPAMLLQKCRENHPGWEHVVWSNAEIRRRFPSAESTVGFLPRDGAHGELVNQDLYGGALNLLSDIARYEVLMLYGGVYVDADTECFRPMDYLVDEAIAGVQGFGFLEKDVHYIGGLVASGVIGTYAYSPLSVALVSELQRTDWNLPPWQSAGPMYFTKILRMFGAGRYRVNVLASHFVYPFHYSDVKPNDLHRHLVRKGAVMDQKWGTTHGAYPTSHWEQDEAVKDHHPYQAIHRLGLSTLALERPRWAVAVLDPQAGLCNRILHILSTLAFAMATERVLLFDWVRSPPRAHENGIEVVGQSDYHDLFRAPLRHSYSVALKKFGWNDQRAHADSVTIHHDDAGFLRALRSEDVDAVYPQPVVFVSRYDWWAHPLLQNPLYAMGPSDGVFAELFRFLFTPVHGNHTPATDCDWLIHRRARWERRTANLSAFEACGRRHGMRTPPVVLQGDGCRSSLQCDIEAVRQMYVHSGCKHAVLTATSTFGACIAGLGRISDAYVVRDNGECVKKAAVDPVGAGALVTEEAVPGVPTTHQALGAVINQPADQDVQNLLRALHDDHTHVPLVLLTDQPRERWAFLPFVAGRRVRFSARGYRAVRWVFNNSV